MPGALLEIVERALARDPADRFASAQDMRQELANLLRAHPEPTDARQLASSVMMARGNLGLAMPSRPPPPLG